MALASTAFFAGPRRSALRGRAVVPRAVSDNATDDVASASGKSPRRGVLLGSLAATIALPAVAATMRPNGTLLVLIKPQFEARRSQIGAKGVVRDPAVHEEVIARVVDGAEELGFAYRAHVVSPIKGAKEGNTEFLAYFTRDDSFREPPPRGPPGKA